MEMSTRSCRAWFGTPSAPPGFHRRTRLLELLDHGRGRRFVLVSAPAGCGKTALVAEWVRTSGHEERTVWATLDSGDGVWQALLGGLERLGVAGASIAAPEDSTGIDRALLADLATGIAARNRRVIVVLDGAEVVSGALGDDLDFLLRHSADRLQLVLITRSDPVMPLYRYRLDETMTELRMADLACDDAEAAALLAASGVQLAPEPLRALNERAQGWVVGLRFAARHLAEVEDPAAAVAEVMGDRGDIAEYLLGEVLDAQTPEVRRLLLATSVADVLRPGLAEALGGGSVGRTLALLTRENAFIEPVPEHPGFYRYHPLFRDLLRAQLAHESPALLLRLQHTAAAWFASHDMPAQSLGHLVAASDWAAATEEVVDRMLLGDLVRSRGPGTVRGLFAGLPSDLPEPAPALVAAATLLAGGDLRRSGLELLRARELLVASADREGLPDIASAGTPDGIRLPGHCTAAEVTLTVLEALHARQSEDPDLLDARCELALGALESPVVPVHVATELGGLVRVSRAQARIRRGCVEDARALLAWTVRRGTASGRDLVEMECLGHLALLACLRGELSLAAPLAARSLRSAQRSGVDHTERTAAAYISLAWVDLAHGDLASAGDHVALASMSGFLAGDPVSRSLLAVVTARHTAARGHAAAAVALLDQALAAVGPADPWIGDLLGNERARLLERTGGVRAVTARQTGVAAASVPAVTPALPAELVEALTPKESEVLGHLAALLTTEEIAATMFVSVNTVRTHVRSILRKLGVSRRNAAVRRARELNLLAV
jgi:LuxR family maltose regulon positive regulatory protein